MVERGSNKHGPNLDEEMKQEAESAVKGVQANHVEEHRQSEPFVDDTDSDEVRSAVRETGVGDDPSDGLDPADAAFDPGEVPPE